MSIRGYTAVTAATGHMLRASSSTPSPSLRAWLGSGPWPGEKESVHKTASHREQEYPISSALSREAGHRAAAPMTGKGHRRNGTALLPWGWCHPCDCTLLAKLASSYSLPASWQALGSHDVIFSKPACRRACLLSFGVGRREGEERLGRTGDLISTQQSRLHTLPTGTLLPATGDPTGSSAPGQPGLTISIMI